MRPIPSLVLVLATIAGCGGGTDRPDAKIDHVMSDCTWPPCVADLLATCEPAGDCTANIDVSSATLTMCHENGVTTRRTISMASATDSCQKSGVLAYSLEQRFQRSGDAVLTVFTLKDGASTIVADGTSSPTTIVVTCTRGDTFSLPPTCPIPPSPATDGGTTACRETPSCSW